MTILFILPHLSPYVAVAQLYRILVTYCFYNEPMDRRIADYYIWKAKKHIWARLPQWFFIMNIKLVNSMALAIMFTQCLQVCKQRYFRFANAIAVFDHRC